MTEEETKAVEKSKKKVRRSFIVLTIVFTILVSILFWQVNTNREQGNRINADRHENIVRDCEGQNERNKNTIEALGTLYDGAADRIRKDKSMTDAEKTDALRMLRDGQSRTVFIINALVPVVKDCEAYADGILRPGDEPLVP